MDGGTAIGIVSLGIQVCQSLLTYYDAWKGYDEDIDNTHFWVADLAKSFALLDSVLGTAEEEHKARIAACLKPCIECLHRLNKKSEKLRDSKEPQGLRQKTRKELQRAWYPFRASTLHKLQETVNELRENVSIALQIAQFDIDVSSSKKLVGIEAQVQAIACSTGTLRVDLTQVLNQTHIVTNTVSQLAGSTELRRVLDWISAPDPYPLHRSLLQRHELGTGDWLFNSEEYRRWRKSDGSIIWLTGIPGSGKSTLCSLVIDRLSREAVKFGFFYFSFSDVGKQSYRGFLASITAQFLDEPLVYQRLSSAHDRPLSSTPSPDLLETLLSSVFKSLGEIVLVIDALDELPEGEDGRQGVIRWLKTTRQSCGQLKVLVTGRQLSDVETAMLHMNAEVVLINKRDTNSDIGIYTRAELERNQKLRNLDPSIKVKIRTVFEDKADGMFRWAFCQLEELKKLKSTRPKYVEKVLECLPPTLDAIYERRLLQIDEMYRPEVFAALRWLTFESEPLTLRELSEAGIVNLHGDGSVDVANRGPLDDILEILASLVSVDTAASTGKFSSEKDVMADVKIRLAHFTVKEFLTSERISRSRVFEFALDPYRDRPILAENCLIYLHHYSDSPLKTSTMTDLVAFPLLQRAAKSWGAHASPYQRLSKPYDIEMLNSEKKRSDWLLVYQPDCPLRAPFSRTAGENDIGDALYHASFLGLTETARSILEQGSNSNRQTGLFGNALQAASRNGRTDTVKLLIDLGADVNAVGGICGTALLAASSGGHFETANLLIENGADINAEGPYGTSLHAASFEGHIEVVELLLNYGADTTSWGAYGSALQGASNGGHKDVVELLLAKGGYSGAHQHDLDEAIRAALDMGHTDVVDLLLSQGLDMI